MTQTVTRLFNDYDDAERAVTELRRLGIPDDDVSLIANNEGGAHSHRVRDGKPDTAGEEAAEDAGKGAGVGALVGGIGGVLAGLGLIAIPGVGPAVAVGWLASAAVGAVGGAVGGAVIGGAAGGLVGAMTHAGVREDDAHVYAEGVRRGGILVSARVPDDLAEAAEATLDGANGSRAGPLGRQYREEGWSPQYPSSAETRLDNDRPSTSIL
jgi:hypothetical protein